MSSSIGGKKNKKIKKLDIDSQRKSTQTRHFRAVSALCISLQFISFLFLFFFCFLDFAAVYRRRYPWENLRNSVRSQRVRSTGGRMDLRTQRGRIGLPRAGHENPTSFAKLLSTRSRGGSFSLFVALTREREREKRRRENCQSRASRANEKRHDRSIWSGQSTFRAISKVLLLLGATLTVKLSVKMSFREF